MRFLSPAKLNLFFHVLHKRPDGYHEIESLYQTIDLFDVLEIEKSSQDTLTCSDPTLDLDKTNLVSRAIDLFRLHYPFATPLKVHLQKNIPIQAGLGGGSSNAATTLWAMNELFGRPATLQQLIEIGAQLGSDVPFFFSQGSALCTGRGEICEEVPFQPLKGWIAKPSFGLSTPLVYQNLHPVDYLAPRQNHLEASAFRLEPRLVHIKAHLEEMGFSSVVMTGSGTAFFCLGDGCLRSLENVRVIPFRAVRRLLGGWYVMCNNLD